MFASANAQAIAAGVVGLIVAGVAVLGVMLWLLRPVLRDEHTPHFRHQRRWVWSAEGRGAIALTVVLAVLGVGAAAFIGDRAYELHSTGAGSQSATSSAGNLSIGTWSPAITPRFTTVDATAALVSVVPTSDDFLPNSAGKWESGDMHSHTFLTGGSNSQSEVAEKAFRKFGLDWMANSEHGGSGERNQNGKPIAATPRWWSLKNWSWPLIHDLRSEYPGKILLQGVEWNLPHGGNASVGFASNDAEAVSEFDFRFDANSDSVSFPGNPSKNNKTDADAVKAVTWLEDNFPDSAYLVINHPTRGPIYGAGDVRDYIAAGPSVTAGFEGLPGHQKQSDRGGYTSSNPWARNYQGADIWLAKVGGLWDSLLGNGSRFSVFTNSDYHATTDDFWPGEYAKNWTFVSNPSDMKSLVTGLKSGRSFVSFGDLVDGLRFSASGDGKAVSMGRDALVVRRGADVDVTIKFHSPPTNANGNKPSVNHLDLIVGNVTGPASKGTASWEASTNPTAHVAKTFSGAEIAPLGDNWYVATCRLSNVSGPIYLRLRATNLAPGTPDMTDAAGNPLPDVAGSNTAAKAWGSLWFYSNPIWVEVQ